MWSSHFLSSTIIHELINIKNKIFHITALLVKFITSFIISCSLNLRIQFKLEASLIFEQKMLIKLPNHWDRGHLFLRTMSKRFEEHRTEKPEIREQMKPTGNIWSRFFHVLSLLLELFDLVGNSMYFLPNWKKE